MLYRNHLMTQLNARRAEFIDFEQASRRDLQECARRLRALAGCTAQAIEAQTNKLSVLNESVGTKSPGALPSSELDIAGGMVSPFGRAWGSHEEARCWAIDVLENRRTFAADGSQLLPGRDISIQVAAVQVACFENPHTRTGDYLKEARFEVLLPQDLMSAEAEQQQQSGPEAIVSLRRFEMEVAETKGFLERRRGWRGRRERMPLAFLDGTLLMSRTPANVKHDRYAEAVVELVKLSRDTEVPVVGFIDGSYARDLISLLNRLSDGPDITAPFDAQVLRADSVDQRAALSAWGDRTIFCRCLREGLSEAFYDERGEPLVGFLYLQTTGDNAPARIDVPTWIYEANLIDEVADTVRAECVVGNGYPYPIEAADSAAVITALDRAQFLRAMQEFAARESFAFQVSRKTASKARRRQ